MGKEAKNLGEAKKICSARKNLPPSKRCPACRTEHEFELTETVRRHATQRPIVRAARTARARRGHHSAAASAGCAAAAAGAVACAADGAGTRTRVGDRGGRGDGDDRRAHRRKDALLVGQTRLAGRRWQ